MSDSWATFGADLHLDLAGTPVRVGLEHALRDAVRTERLHPGTRLPSSRALARDLGIARNTVADAYGQLVAEGWLTARQGSATRVADSGRRGRRRAVAGSDPAEARSATTCAPARPTCRAFPRAAWLAAARQALAIAPDEALGYSDPRGRPELHRALADYLSRARGVRVTADRVVVCSGFAQGLALLCHVLRARGATTLAMEAYGHRQSPCDRDRRRAPTDGAARRRPRCGDRRLIDADAVLLDAGPPVPARDGAGAGAADAQPSSGPSTPADW